MPPIIVNPADCEVRAVVRFLSAKGLKAIDLHREMCAIYGENVTSDGMVRKWVTAFKDGRTNVHDEQRSGRPSVVDESLLQEVDDKVRENRRFTISFLRDDVPNVSRSVLYGIVTEQDNDEVKTVVMQWITSQAADFYDEGIQELVKRDKCLNIDRNCVEK